MEIEINTREGIDTIIKAAFNELEIIYRMRPGVMTMDANGIATYMEKGLITNFGDNPKMLEEISIFLDNVLSGPKTYYDIEDLRQLEKKAETYAFDFWRTGVCQS
ncbi:hypothetical protein HYV88_04230 [Candidatus Woesearchaeota archaeon]|nr:hypothetical protein [Candidatus Woesearchaeota archaeon]